ncbi:coiled-coil domain-containing protein [Tepidibacter formicigenes]|jgi:predicted  nucleic acid-binding Zn-ribbon protein|uniref:Uncharacterized protein n=1 Tax=Tepidibacter formicigenes DSM 15518 TaxID=1123349 RepID=A0A1M6MR92_9FIRM|nr:hypothetical protein [Tepidibacter formicigenes]SHJ86035.1 hypothetical protein SAMN02744037_01031 [Tepidibacter formicigenes DSM 15518]
MIFGRKQIDIDLAEKIIKKNKIPVLTQYEPWKKLFNGEVNKEIKAFAKELEEALNKKKELEKELFRLQGQKPKKMAKIIYISNELNENKNKAAEIELDNLKNEMEDINNNINIIFEELEVLPKLIEEKNLNLLKATVKYAYDDMNKGEDRLDEIQQLIGNLRKELDLLREEKEYIEEKVNYIYNFLHSLLGYKDMEKLDNKLLK